MSISTATSAAASPVLAGFRASIDGILSTRLAHDKTTNLSMALILVTLTANVTDRQTENCRKNYNTLLSKICQSFHRDRKIRLNVEIALHRTKNVSLHMCECTVRH